MRAVSMVRRLYNVQSPFDWRPHHDKVALKILHKLQRGEEIPDCYRNQYKEPPPIDVSSWGKLGYW